MDKVLMVPLVIILLAVYFTEPPAEKRPEIKSMSIVGSNISGNKKNASNGKILSDTERYIERFKATAISEMKKYKIPASITLAQGIIESRSGKSDLAKIDNNHFGIKCRKKCLGCRCVNYPDDSPYDMFRIFPSAWYSYREHSKLLVGSPRYRELFRLKITDYKGWAHGLQKAGYATSKKYAVSLIRIIEKYNLQKFDKL